MTESEIRKKKLFVLDMDGTFYLGNRIFDGSLPFVKKVRETGRKFMFFTNNSSHTSDFYIKKLARMGCDITPEEMLTSGDVTIDYLNREQKGKKVFLLGTDLLRKSFVESGIPLVEDDPDIVVLGFDMTMSYERVNRACKFIRNGAAFVATHPDLNCPTEEGFDIDCGSMCAMFTASTGVAPRYLGKPYIETLNAVVHISGYKKEDIAFVGDRLYTDIAIGAKNGVTSILVLSGETAREDVDASDVKPDIILPSIGTLAEIL